MRRNADPDSQTTGFMNGTGDAIHPGPSDQLVCQLASMPFDGRLLHQPLTQNHLAAALLWQPFETDAIVGMEKTTRQGERIKTAISPFQINADWFSRPREQQCIPGVTDAHMSPSVGQKRSFPRRGREGNGCWFMVKQTSKAMAQPLTRETELIRASPFQCSRPVLFL